MNNERARATVVAWLLPALLFPWLLLPTPAAAAEARVRVVTSIPPLAMIVAELGGGRVEVRSILPAGVDPHLFEPRPSDMRAVAEADLVVMLGSSIDDWIEPALRSASAPRVLALDPHDDHDSHDGHAHDHDPHVWLDPTWVRDRALRPLHRELAALDPAWAPLHGAQARAMGERLTDLDDDIREMLSDLSTRSFLALHPAWGHFARRFGLRPVAAAIDGHGREPSLHAMIEAVWAARAAGVHTLLVEPQVDARLAQVLAREIGAGFEMVDPLGDRSLSDRSSYGALLRFNAHAFARALGKRDEEEVEKSEGEAAIDF